MSRKLAVKRLTASDLTFFEWHFRNRNAGNQKAINLNADVFIDRLYPALPEIAAETGGKIPLDLFIYGPGFAGEINLQRKIIKFGAYKNWRLNGEFIFDPADQPNRYHGLEPGDYAIFDFEGKVKPVSARMVLVARNVPADSALHKEIAREIGEEKMVAISVGTLTALIERSGTAADHPIGDLVEGAALEDAAQGGVEGAQRLRARRKGRKLTRDELLKARRNADDIGMLGEELLNAYFEQLKSRSNIKSFEWVSKTNAVAPYDFSVVEIAGNTLLLDAKSTVGDFDRTIHISVSELLQMVQGSERYDIYRLYEVSGTEAKLRIARDVKEHAASILEILDKLPAGVHADGISLSPSILRFEREILIELPEEPPVESTGGEADA